MSLGAESLAAGQYTVSYASSSVGIFEGDGGVPALESQGEEEAIASTDKYGRCHIESLFLGANGFFSGTLLEYSSATRAVIWPWGAAMWRVGTIARYGTDMASALVLTAVAGTPAASLGPASITLSKALLAAGFPVKLLYGPTLRKMPLRLRLYPFSSGGNVVLGTET